MKSCFLYLFLFCGIALKAQYLNTEVGGAGLYCPQLTYEHLVREDSTLFSNGIKLKAGGGYWEGENGTLGVFKLGAYWVWGKRNNFETGLEAGKLYGQISEGIDSWMLYPSINFRLGSGRFKGLLSLGPLIFGLEEGPIILPFASAGVGVKLF